MKDLQTEANRCQFTIHEMGWIGSDPLLALARDGTSSNRSLYLSAGIHGDEPAGPLALLRLLKEGAFPQSLRLCLCPLLNPLGTRTGTRENGQGLDINRDYLELETPEAKYHSQWLSQNVARFTLLIALHEDCGAAGYYLYELNRHKVPSPAQSILNSVSPIVGIDHSSLIEGYPAAESVLHPPLDLALRPQWPESCYLLAHCGNLVYTFECPTNCTVETRIAAHIEAVKAAVSVLENY